MLDQNTTLLIASTITVIGTLGGAISGVVLTNHHSTKLEKLKIEQEKLKRKSEIVEEIYSLLLKIDSRTMNNITYQKDVAEGLADELGCVQTLARLYLPSVTSYLVDKFLDAHGDLGVTIMLASSPRTKDDEKNITSAFKVYHASLADAYKELEKTVK